ncbi:GNAT family N-acetyltransferase [Candidatus Bathyarchaeota archaeon]|nr:GNAT family N-acetyltransferase [Candidatus Bathyarchaeota archaeon]
MRITKKKVDSQFLYTLLETWSNRTIGRATVTEDRHTVRIHTLYVEPEFRGRGYGEKLIKKILEDFRDKKILLSTHYGGVGFFRKYGFKLEVERPSRHSTLISMVRKPSPKEDALLKVGRISSTFDSRF